MTSIGRAALWTLTSFVTVNISLCLLLSLFSDQIVAHAARFGPLTRVRVLLAARFFPVAGAIWVATAIVLPSFLVFEPNTSVERVPVTTVALTVVAVGLLVSAAWRGARALYEASRLSRSWLGGAEPWPCMAVPVPVYLVSGTAPAMTLIGILRPSLLVSKPLLDILTVEELNAAFEHEIAHVRSADNLKRLAMRVLPDALFVCSCARRFEREWAVAAERAADARAAWDLKAGLALASALVKAARLPAGEQGALASPLVDGEVITARVERLMERPATSAVPLARRVLYWSLSSALALVLIAGHSAPLAKVHQVSEELFEHVLP